MRRWSWRIIQLGPRLFYKLGLGAILGRSILLLMTRGRKTGLLRTTPLVYEERDGVILVASARGHSADWLQNIRSNPHVQLQIGRHTYAGSAEIVQDPGMIAGYLARQYRQKPRLFGAILRAEGVSSPPAQGDLVRLASKRPMVKIVLEEGRNDPQS